MKPIKLKNASHHLRHKQLSGLKSERSRRQWERVLNPVPSLPSTFVSKLTLLGTNSLSNPAYLVWFTVCIRTLTGPGIFFLISDDIQNIQGQLELLHRSQSLRTDFCWTAMRVYRLLQNETQQCLGWVSEKLVEPHSGMLGFSKCVY